MVIAKDDSVAEGKKSFDVLVKTFIAGGESREILKPIMKIVHAII